MEYLVNELGINGYLRFEVQAKGKNSYAPQLRVVFRQYNNLTIGIPLGEVIASVENYGVKETCASLEHTLMTVLTKIRRDHPGFLGD